MIAKKSSKADLERKRFAFFQIGLIVAGSLTLAAFEYSSANVEKQKVAIVEDQGGSYTFEPMVMEDIPAEKPEPQRNMESRVQTLPTDQVTIVTQPINPNVIYTNQKIVVNDPCTDCIETGILIEEPTDPIIDVPDKEPSFPGGADALTEFIVENTSYPSILADMGVGGTAYVEFVVNTDGSICQVITRSDVHKELKKEAERVVKMMPNWIPGEQAGKAVRVRYVVPINFKVK